MKNSTDSKSLAVQKSVERRGRKSRRLVVWKEGKDLTRMFDHEKEAVSFIKSLYKNPAVNAGSVRMFVLGKEKKVRIVVSFE